MKRSHLKQTRAFCDLRDGALGTILAMEYESSSSEIFHIGSDEEITIEEFVKEVGSLFGYHGPYVTDETYPGSVGRRCPDLTKARNLLGYAPSIDWRSAVKRSVEWYIDYFSVNNFSYFKDPYQVKALLR
jgi:UDP-glucose 4-epimerase